MTSPTPSRSAVNRNGNRSGEEGYLLLGLVVACFLLLLALSVAAPRVAKELERDREVETEHRAQEYVRAIKLFYAKNNSYPTTVEQLLGSGTSGSVGPAAKLKFLRQAYKDPLTNDEFRLIHLGEAKTQVKGFFGEPLQGIPTTIAGATPASNMNSSPAGTFGGTSAPGSSFGGGAAGATGTTGGTSGASGSTGSSSPFGSNNASTFQGSKGAIVGVGSNAKGHGLVEWNGSENIEEWEFLYDPRVELLKAKVSLFGGSPAASGINSAGSGFGSAGGAGSTGNTGFGSGSSFGSGSGFGGSSTSGAGGSTGSTGSTGTTTGNGINP